MTAPAVPVVHAITDDAIARRPDFLRLARRFMEALGPRGALHLRAPSMSGRDLYSRAAELASVQAASLSWLVVSDRMDVAMASGARGVQLPTRSIVPGDARRIVPASGLGIGVSVHTLTEGREAEAAGAEWVLAGHIYETPSHAGYRPQGEGFVRAIAGAIATPVVAIGGVRPEHAGRLHKAGAAGIAAIRGLWEAPDIAVAGFDYLSAYDAGL